MGAQCKWFSKLFLCKSTVLRSHSKHILGRYFLTPLGAAILRVCLSVCLPHGELSANDFVQKYSSQISYKVYNYTWELFPHPIRRCNIEGLPDVLRLVVENPVKALKETKISLQPTSSISSQVWVNPSWRNPSSGNPTLTKSKFRETQIQGNLRIRENPTTSSVLIQEALSPSPV